MGRLNIFLGIIAFLILSYTFWKENTWLHDQWNSLLADNSHQFDFETLDKITKNRLSEKYLPLPKVEINNLAGISFNEYSKIQFKPEAAIWKNIGLPFQLQFFHPGHLYNQGVRIYQVDKGAVQEFEYRDEFYNFKDIKLSDEFRTKTKDLKFTGFRIHYPINSDNLEEFAVFQGASYFRILSKSQVHGLSGRGIAINTGIPNREEFPDFDSFYIVKPDEFDNSITAYATLNGESVVGTYRFIFHPGVTTQVQVKARIYLRKPVKRFGIAPLTSMFLYGETNEPIGKNIYPEVHDSDGLLIEDKTGDWTWRQLVNPSRSIVLPIEADSIKGFGLIQRDRKFKSYQDNKLKYHLRPSAWVKPKNNWGTGTIQLMQNATLLDSDDNIGVFFEPKIHPKVNQAYDFEYNLYFPDMSPPNHRLAKVSSVFKGSDPVYPNQDVMTLYFKEIHFEGEKIEEKIKVSIKTNPQLKNLNHSLEKIEELNQVRLILRYDKIHIDREKPLKWEIFLTEDNQKISETWVYINGL